MKFSPYHPLKKKSNKSGSIIPWVVLYFINIWGRKWKASHGVQSGEKKKSNN